MSTKTRRALVVLLMAVQACAPRAAVDPATARALGDLASEVDGDSLMGMLSQLVDNRHADTPQDCSFMRSDLYPPLCHLTHQRSGAWMEAQLASYGLKVYRQEIADPQLPTSNLIAELPGVTKPEEVVLVGAHFDAFYSGADDNGSGAAAVLELARVLSKHRFARTVRFVGFDLEELSLIGSGRYVPSLGSEKLVVAVVYDCIGYYSSKPGSQQSLPGLPSPPIGDFLAVIANDQSSSRASEIYALSHELNLMKLVPILSPRDGSASLLGDTLRSDHTSFWLNGLPALFLTDTAFLRNPNYHRDTDTLETIDPASFTQAVRVSAAALGYWAGGPQ